jgi:hypothetical protein
LGPLRATVEAVQGQTLAPIAIPAQSALATAALAVMAHADVETLGGSRLTALYALTVAKSGERKSSCDAPFMAELRAFEREQAKTRPVALQSWQNAHGLWSAARDRIFADAKKSAENSRIEAEVDLDALGLEPAPPPHVERVVTEPTFEGLTRLLAEGMPALGIFSDEGGQFLGGYAMGKDNRQKTLAALNDIWQGNPIRRTRSGDGSLTLHGRRLAMHLMVQPGVVRNFMADPMTADTGFLPRFLICEPPSTIGKRFHSLVQSDEASINAFSTRLRAILEMPLPMDPETRELTPRTLRLSDEARAQLIAFSDDIEARQGPGGEMAGISGYAS